jgi:hypothetical protein
MIKYLMRQPHIKKILMRDCGPITNRDQVETFIKSQIPDYESKIALDVDSWHH